jgi:hypothetical protein
MNHNHSLGVDDLVNDSIGATSCRPHTSKFSLKESSNPIWIIDKGTQHELNNCNSDIFWQPRQVALRRSGHAEFKGCLVITA